MLSFYAPGEFSLGFELFYDFFSMNRILIFFFMDDPTRVGASGTGSVLFMLS
jgi:hypothetical protein